MSLERIEKIRSQEKFINSEIDAIFVIKPENIIYILGFKIESDVLIIIPKKDQYLFDNKVLLFLNALEYNQVKKKILTNINGLSKEIEIIQIPPGKPNFFRKTIKKYKLSSVGFEDDYISVKRYREWKQKYSISKFISCSEIIKKARIVKTQKEIDIMKKSAKLGNIGFNAIFGSIEEGKTEKQLAAEAEYAMRKAGSDGTSFDTIVASGEQSAFPHATTSEKKVHDGDIILVDIGARFEGYCSDMTRTFIFGKVDSEKAKLINLVNDCQQLVLNNIKAGEKCVEMDKLARDFFIKEAKKWGSRFIHNLGHGVGIDVHENPYLSPTSQEILEKNMVVTVEPGLYIPGLGGARTEDQIVIKKESFFSLTESKKYYY
ncbi:MAG: M24 family metallopeptidase [Promethearchaeota archaeon]